MRRDRTDEETIRHLVRRTASSRSARQATDDADRVDCCPIVSLLHETARLWCGRYDREIRAQLPGMTRARCVVLLRLVQHEGVSQANIAQILDIRPITLSRLVDRLEAAGFIARTPDPGDRRAHILTLTGKALPIIDRIDDITKKIGDDAQFGITPTETAQLRALLCRVQANLAGRPGVFPASE
jgi:DNA-binding MarR family transcriptional regulator